MTHHTHDNHSPHHPTACHGHGAAFQSEWMADVLEAEGELSAGITSQAIALCADQLDGNMASIQGVVDLGCGPGVATSQLAQSFGGAMVVGVDDSDVMLRRAKSRAKAQGVTAQAQFRNLDLNDDLTTLGSFDLVWAALALHHAKDEQDALNNFAALLSPQGLLCLLERADPMVVRPSTEFGQPGIWDRVEAARVAWSQRTVGSLPGESRVDSYAAMFQRAGLELLDERVISHSRTTPAQKVPSPLIQRYLGNALRNLRDLLAPADVKALAHANDQMSDKHAADMVWGDILVTSSRSLFIARPAIRKI